MQRSTTSNDSKLLKMLIENDNVTAEMTVGQVQKKYKMFSVYAYKTFSSALRAVVKSRQSEFSV